jgi:hypothetical protein
MGGALVSDESISRIESLYQQIGGLVKPHILQELYPHIKQEDTFGRYQLASALFFHNFTISKKHHVPS